MIESSRIHQATSWDAEGSLHHSSRLLRPQRRLPLGATDGHEAVCLVEHMSSAFVTVRERSARPLPYPCGMRISELLRGGLQLVRGLLRTGKWGVRIESGVRLRGRGNYDLHPGCVIRSHARIYVERGATLTLHPRASIGGSCDRERPQGLRNRERDDHVMGVPDSRQ